jgi:maltose phosphorylase
LIRDIFFNLLMRRFVSTFVFCYYKSYVVTQNIQTVKKYIVHHPWKIIEEGYKPELNRISESLFSLGNGKFGQRGNFEEYFSGETLQGNYLGGVYYPDKTRVGWWKNGYPEYFAKVLNAPDWNGIRIKINNQELDPHRLVITDFSRYLDMQDGSLNKSYTAQFDDGKKVKIQSTRFLSIVNDELGAIKYSITPLNFSGDIEVILPVDGDIKNQDANYDEQFWNEIEKSASARAPYLIVETRKTAFRACYAMHYSIQGNNKSKSLTQFDTIEKPKYIAHKLDVGIEEGKTTTIYKYVAVVSSMYHENDDMKEVAAEVLAYAKHKGFGKMLDEQKAAWDEKWNRADIVIEGDVAAQQGIRYNIFQLNQTYTGQDERLNIGPKGFTGEKYGGGTYWDTEAYLMPFYLSTSKPEVARNLLIYRFKHLQKAIENAEKLGFSHGAALYPMVTMNGEECHNEWEITFEEIHRNGAIAHAIYNYIRYTDDKEYLAEYGLEVLIAISRFWAQRVNFSEEKQQHVMLGVTGPNEYDNNVNNNWYTLRMAKWTMEYTQESINYVKNTIPEEWRRIATKTSFDEDTELKTWDEICNNLYEPYDEKRQVFLQQDGFLDKELQPVSAIPENQKPIHKHWSWDRILRSCYIKQADVLQGLYFFEEHFDQDTIRRNYDFYEPMTVHESSLSACIHSIMAAKLGDEKRSYEFYLSASRLDLDDYNSDTDEGLHVTSMGGTWMTIVQGFGGMRVRNNMLVFSPFIPEKWESFAFKIMFRNHLINITIDKSNVSIFNEADQPLEVKIYEKYYTIGANGTVLVDVLDKE